MVAVSKKQKPDIVHVDILGNKLEVGMFVASHYGSGVSIFRILRLAPKMVKVVKINTHQAKELNRYPHDTVILDKDVVLFNVLKNDT